MNLKEKLIELSIQNLHPVGETGFFVKTFTVGELDDILREKAQFPENEKLERNFAFELYDQNGNRVFNPHDERDLDIIKNLPAAFVAQVLNLSQQVNGSDFFTQKINQMSANSTTETNSSLN